MTHYLSAPWYFDYHKREASWEKDYLINPVKGLNKKEKKNMIGGEAAIWTEYVDASNIYSLIFPRLRYDSLTMTHNYDS